MRREESASSPAETVTGASGDSRRPPAVWSTLQRLQGEQLTLVNFAASGSRNSRLPWVQGVVPLGSLTFSPSMIAMQRVQRQNRDSLTYSTPFKVKRKDFNQADSGLGALRCVTLLPGETCVRGILSTLLSVLSSRKDCLLLNAIGGKPNVYGEKGPQAHSVFATHADARISDGMKCRNLSLSDEYSLLTVVNKLRPGRAFLDCAGRSSDISLLQFFPHLSCEVKPFSLVAIAAECPLLQVLLQGTQP